MSGTPVAGLAGADMSAASDLSPTVIAVAPGVECRLRARLFAALEAAYPVRFVPAEGIERREIAGLVAFGEDGVAPAAWDPPCLAFRADERPPATARPLRFGTDTAPAAPLRGARLSERHGDDAPAVRVGAATRSSPTSTARRPGCRPRTGQARSSPSPPQSSPSTRCSATG